MKIIQVGTFVPSKTVYQLANNYILDIFAKPVGHHLNNFREFVIARV